MAKSSGAFLSLESNGTVGNVLTARRGKSGGILTGYSFPGSRRRSAVSSAQAAVRERFYEAKTAWNELSADEKEEYTTRAFPLKITGYNLFIREFEPDMLKKHTVTISAAQIKDLVANPVVILPAADTGKYRSIIQTVTVFNPGDTPFEDGETIILSRGDVSLEYNDQLCKQSKMIGSDKCVFESVGMLKTGPDGAGFTDFGNVPYSIFCYTTDYTAGNGTLEITSYYVETEA